MSRIVDLAGQRIGRWIVVLRAANRGSATMWLCRCDCGLERPVWAGDLRSGTSVSCGCKTDKMKKEMSARRMIHGHARPTGGKESREYRSWAGSKQRCSNPKAKDMPHYRARGISMCERWSESFENFLADMGPCPRGMSIDRINNNGNYEPTNCRWATYTQQNRNRSFKTDVACRRGHERTAGNTYISPAGSRYCITCRKMQKVSA